MKSIIQKTILNDFSFYVKRDDLLGDINGNKARKLAYFIENKEKFKNKCFVSFGSSQSNALVALSIFTYENNIKLIFVCEKISNYLKQNPSGNYAIALKNKANIIENTTHINARSKAMSLLKNDDIFIEEGVAIKQSEYGFIQLAKEIKEQSKKLNIKFDIFLPSGTGTSAAFLAKHSDFEVFTTACVGGNDYLKKQILALEPNFDFNKIHILDIDKKFHFANLYKEHISLYKNSLKQCNIEFDLLYDMIGLRAMLINKKIFKNPVLYIHQGGILGNETMLERYKYKKLY